MGNNYFKFKQFIVSQDDAAMRVNTDGVLLGAWMSLAPSDRRLLDIGTGTGVIALMAAQRLQKLNKNTAQKEFSIHGIDSDKNACLDAKKNFENSPWANNINLENIDFQSFAERYKKEGLDKFDVIFSNPPYFTDSLKSSSAEKSSAKHNDNLSQSDLIRGVGESLKTGGKFALILPIDEAENFIRKINFLEEHISQREQFPFLQLVRRCNVIYEKDTPPRRVLMEFSYSGEKTEYSVCDLTVQSKGAYTKEYKELTKEFYLNF